jgi:outer membrane protein OmpA-like peptidoglycan-associated protein
MKILTFKRVIFAATAPILMVACTSVQPRFAGADQVRARLSQLESNQDLAAQSPLAMKEARDAVLQAEQRQKNSAISEHLVFIAQRKVDIAETESKKLYLEEQRSEMNVKRDAMQLQARTNETNKARQETNQAEKNAIEAQRQARRAQSDAAIAQQEMNKAEQETAKAQQQLKDLDARQEARGTVVTLGDVLFDFNKAEIKPAAISHLAKLATFLNKNIDRNATIEGHTDNVGANDFNMLLSQQRADAIKDYLQSQGVAGTRMNAVGKGAEFPVTDNSTAPKRQQNRRVEVIIADPIT